jgi:hypothetical protein
MPSELILLTPLVKNRKTWTNAMLINADNIVTFKADPSYTTTRTILYYNYGDSTWEFTLSHSINTVSTRLLETVTNDTIWMHVITSKPNLGMEKSVDAKWKVASKNILFAYDIDTTTSYVFMKKGNGVLRLKTSHLVSDLSRAYSQSSSLSAS